MKSIKNFVLLAGINAAIIVCAQPMEAQQQKKATAVYELGDTMLDLLIEQSAYEGASPAELKGIRQGFMRQLEENPIIITLFDDLTFSLVNGDSEMNLIYRMQGSRLFAKNGETGEEHELGFFNKDRSQLTINKTIILDRRE